MAQELTFNISEDRRKLQGPVEAKDFNLKFGTDDVAITHGNPKQWVQGRIGDDQLKQVFVNITEGENNTPKDIAGLFLAFVGIIHDKDGRPHRVVDYKHSTTIDVEHGRFRFDFPDQAFTVGGEYQQAFFMLVNEGPGGGCVATMEFDMQVMANFVFTDLVPEDYITPFNDTVDQLLAACKKFKEDTAADEAKFKQELDDAYAKFQKDTNTQFSNFKDATDDDLAKFKKANADDIANFKQQYADAVKAKQDELQSKIDSYTDKLDTLLKDLNQQGIDTTTLMSTLQVNIKSLEDKIKQDGLFTQAEAKQFEDLVTTKLAKSSYTYSSLDQLLKDSALAADSFCQTKGYYEPGDGGQAMYQITSEKPNEYFEKLTNGLYAKLLPQEELNVKQFGAKANNNTDDSAAIQTAIYQAVKFFPQVNTVVLPGGTYKVESTIIVPPYIKLKALGLVTMISNFDNPVLWVKWLGDGDPHLTQNPLGTPWSNDDYQRGSIVNGTQGGFSLISKSGMTIGVGLKLGEDEKEKTFKHVARYSIGDISISGFKVALQLTGENVYIGDHSHFHIENNSTGIELGQSDPYNSGENITFENSVISKCNKAVDIKSTMDTTWTSCSFDFNNTVFTTPSDADSNIFVVGGNIEGNKLIVDATASSSAEWKPTVTFLGSVIYVRNDVLDNPDTAQFKGPMSLNLADTNLNARNNINGVSYLCDSAVIVDRQGSLRNGRRDGKRYLLAERFNQFAHGRSLQMSVLANNKSDNGKVELRTKDSGLDQAMQDTLLPSALVYEHKADDGSNWDKLTFNQHIDVSRSSSYALSTWILFTNSAETFDFKVKFYTSDDYLVRTDDIYFYDAAPSDKPQFLRAFPKDVPYYCDYAVVEATLVAKNVGDKVEIGYIGFEC